MSTTPNAPNAPTAASAAWSVARLLGWIDQVEARLESLTLFDLLEIPPTAAQQHVRQGFYAIAISRHPDLWRNRLTSTQLDRLVRVYGRVAAAYATLRDPDERARYLRSTRESAPDLGRAARDSQPGPTRPVAAAERPPGRPAVDSQPPPVASTGRPAGDSRPPPTAPTAPTSGRTGAAALGPRAQSYFRRAEAAAQRGDGADMLLNLRLAVAAEPSSAFLRQALAAAQAELQK